MPHALMKEEEIIARHVWKLYSRGTGNMSRRNETEQIGTVLGEVIIENKTDITGVHNVLI